MTEQKKKIVYDFLGTNSWIVIFAKADGENPRDKLLIADLSNFNTVSATFDSDDFVHEIHREKFQNIVYTDMLESETKPCGLNSVLFRKFNEDFKYHHYIVFDLEHASTLFPFLFENNKMDNVISILNDKSKIVSWKYGEGFFDREGIII